jgi:hypothetical protein
MEEIRIMRTRISWLALLLTAGIALAPAGARAQDKNGQDGPLENSQPPSLNSFVGGEVSSGRDTPLLGALIPSATIFRGQMNSGQDVPRADPVFPVPLYHDRPETGGFFFAGEFLYWRQTNPIGHQTIAIRGFQDDDGTILGPPAGKFAGSGQPALFADDGSGRSTFTPGYHFSLGYRFGGEGLTVSLDYYSLFHARYSAGATLVPQTFPPPGQLDPALANTFLFSPVYNFPPAFAGNGLPKVGAGDAQATYGIWNAASEETIKFDQRLDRWEVNFRIPVWQTDTDPCAEPEGLGARCYGLAGFERVWLWERFSWRVVSRDSLGNADPTTVALYSNTLSQPLYGPYVGYGMECYAGNGFAVTLDAKAALLADFGREIVKYQRGDFATQSKFANREYDIVPELRAQLNVWWYPIEGVQIRVGYDFFTLINTLYSPDPVAFNFDNPDPGYKHLPFRLFDGFNAGIAFIF